MNTVFGGYTGAGYTYDGSSSDSEHTLENSTTLDGSNMSDSEKNISNEDTSETMSTNDVGNMSEGSGFSGSETNVNSIVTDGLTGGAFQNKKDFNQSWFIEKHRLPNKSKSRDHNKFDELVEIILEALKSHN